MTQFRTELFIEKNPNKITFQSNILSIGSGFSHMLDDHLRKHKLQVASNPFGTIYNPISIFNIMEIIAKKEKPKSDFLTENNGLWNHYDFHQKVNAFSMSELETQLDETVAETHQYFKKTDFLFLTFGTAYAYKLNTSNHIVANCHKSIPSEFEKILLTPEEIVAGFRKVYKLLNNVKDIVLIVSPVMHTRDSITLNAVSKSVLRVACHSIKNEFPHVKYFPAYEFLISDLREYRFYEKDMIHPTETAIDYIFQKLVEAYFNEDDRQIILEVEKILEAIDLLPYNPQGNEKVTQLKEAIKKIEELNDKIDLSDLLIELKSRI